MSPPKEDPARISGVMSTGGGTKMLVVRHAALLATCAHGEADD